MSKKIAIIGGGLTGISLAYYLSKKNYHVVVFEKEAKLGGLTQSFKLPQWDWSLENHYHHIFSNDQNIIQLARKVGVEFQFHQPNTSSLIRNHVFRLSSPLDFLKFPYLSFFNRLRMIIILAYFKLTPFWKHLEKHTSQKWLIKFMGKKNFDIIWLSLFKKKFHHLKSKISLTWFYGRIKKRTVKLGYPKKGFANLIQKIVTIAKKQKCQFLYNSKITNLSTTKKSQILVHFNQLNKKKKMIFDQTIITTSNQIMTKIVKNLPLDYCRNIAKTENFATITIVLILKKSFLKNQIYWLNINNEEYPFLAIIEHTNFIKSKFYNHQHLVYISQYLPFNHPLMTLHKKDILKIYLPHLKKINSEIKNILVDFYMFKNYYAQPIVTSNFSQKKISFQTPIKNIFLVNMNQVYPYDRGTNYAVSLAKKFVKYYAKIKP